MIDFILSLRVKQNQSWTRNLRPIKMNIKSLSIIAVLLIGTMVGLDASHAGRNLSPQQSPQPQTDWTKRVTVSEVGGHVLGNPLARKRLVEYVSYSCPHCATYAAASARPIETRYISKGTVSVEVRSFVRDLFDLTAAMLARCGTPDKFFDNHRAILASQQQWMARAQSPDPIAKRRWQTQDQGKRLQYIASDVGLRALMHKRGYDDKEIDQCLSDELEQSKLVDMTRYAVNTVKLEGTPGFTINDKYLPKTHSWRHLEPHLRNALQGL